MGLKLVGKNIELGDDTLTRLGDQNATVTQIQNILNSNGYPTGEVDGIFGEKTRQAVIAFQSSQGLQADGIVGPQTWAALMKLSTPTVAPTIKPAPTPIPVVARPQIQTTPWSTYAPYVILFGLIYLAVNGKK